MEKKGKSTKPNKPGDNSQALDQSLSTIETQKKQKTPNQTYSTDKIIGNGSFGVVYQATLNETGETVAIKKVFQDRRYKNRELQIMREISHQNCITLKHAFYTQGEKPDELYLNVVMDFMPETVYRVQKHYSKTKSQVPILLVKLYSYQMFRSLAYIHSKGICHRDIKPQNLLVDPQKHILKLCDFGSAKKLIKGEPNISYICSRYYRAPELVFGATNYTFAIDVWSVGCVISEMLLNQPLFPGESGVDQLVEIIKVLGTPNREQINAMNPNYTEFKFPQIKANPWNKVFKSRTPTDAIDLISLLLVYPPEQRLKPMETLMHPFFDELRDPNTKLPNGQSLPDLFNFTKEERSQCTPEILERIIPSWYNN